MGLRRTIVDVSIFGLAALGAACIVFWGKQNLGVAFLIASVGVSVFRRQVYDIMP